MTPIGLAADDQRRPEPATSAARPGSRRLLRLDRSIVSRRSLISSGSRVSDRRACRMPIDRTGSSGKRTPRSIVVREADQVRASGRGSPMSIDLGVEDLPHPLADELVHRLHLELRGQALLDVVDDRELGRPLVRLGQQPLGLVEQARVLERDAHARGKRAEQALVGLAEGVLEGLSRIEDRRCPRSPDLIGTPSQDSVTVPPRSMAPASIARRWCRGGAGCPWPGPSRSGRCRSPWAAIGGGCPPPARRPSGSRRWLVDEADRNRSRVEDRPDPLAHELA